MDEKIMVMEQDRIAKEKKRKKTLKKVRIGGAIVLVIVIAGVWYLGWGCHMNEEEETAVQIVASTGQEIIYADLISVKGNEITYRVTQEANEETVTALIPVGTDVTTKLGTVTTFSRLAAGDKVALVVENMVDEQIIMAVYIIE